jgi:hypothetical protein
MEYQLSKSILSNLNEEDKKTTKNNTENLYNDIIDDEVEENNIVIDDSDSDSDSDINSKKSDDENNKGIRDENNQEISDEKNTKAENSINETIKNKDDMLFSYPSIVTDYRYIQDNVFLHRENEFIEFKENTIMPLELSKAFSGFSNHLGGSLYVGITDDGKIKGKKMNTKQIDEFKLFVDDVQQNFTYPPITGVKINLISIYTSEQIIIPETYIIRIDIPKLNKNIIAKDGKKYVRYNASFRTEDVQTFVRIGEYESVQSKCVSLQKDLDAAKKRISGFEKNNKDRDNKEKKDKKKFDELNTKNKKLEEEIKKWQENYELLEIKLKNYDTVFSQYLLVKK